MRRGRCKEVVVAGRPPKPPAAAIGVGVVVVVVVVVVGESHLQLETTVIDACCRFSLLGTGKNHFTFAREQTKITNKGTQTIEEIFYEFSCILIPFLSL